MSKKYVDNPFGRDNIENDNKSHKSTITLESVYGAIKELKEEVIKSKDSMSCEHLTMEILDSIEQRLEKIDEEIKNLKVAREQHGILIRRIMKHNGMPDIWV